MLAEERVFNSPLKYSCPSKAETELSPNIMGQKNVPYINPLKQQQQQEILTK